MHVSTKIPYGVTMRTLVVLLRASIEAPIQCHLLSTAVENGLQYTLIGRLPHRTCENENKALC